MKFCFFLSSLNPLSLMKSTRFFRNFVFLFSLLGLGSFAWGVRLEALYASNGSSPWLEISQNEKAVIQSFYSVYDNSGYLNYRDPDQSEVTLTRRNFDGSGKFEIFGPCEIKVKSTQSGINYSVTSSVIVSSNVSMDKASKYASVIPENAKTNVSVILEQSTDLVNWTAASPGEFTPSTSKRFFRVRTANIPVAITGASNAAPIVITSAGHGLSTGDAISVTGVAGNTAANGVFTITKVDDNSFSLNGSTGNAAYTSGGTWLPSP
jgi:hypothetical protein